MVSPRFNIHKYLQSSTIKNYFSIFQTKKALEIGSNSEEKCTVQCYDVMFLSVDIFKTHLSCLSRMALANLKTIIFLFFLIQFFVKRA